MTRESRTQHGNSPGGERWWYGFALCFLTLIGLASFGLREPLWGIHSLAFFPEKTRFLLLGIAAAFLLPAVHNRLFTGLTGVLSLKSLWLLIAVCSMAAVYIFYSNPIETTIYGDANNVPLWYGDNAKFNIEWIGNIFSLDLLSHKYPVTIALHRSVAFLFSIPITESYKIISAISGGLFIFLWLSFVRDSFRSSPLGPAMMLGGLFLGSSQIFFGHVENYAVPFLTGSAFLIALYRSFDNKARPWHVFALFVLSVKTHSIAIVFLPALLVAAVWYASRTRVGLERWLNWKILTPALILPLIAGGALLYFFYFKSHAEPHFAPGRQFEHMFLPIVPSPPPADGYTLQSWNHILDFFNVLLLNGLPLILMGVWFIFTRRKTIQWDHPRVLCLSLAAFFSTVFFFSLNPELSLPRDWDLFTLAIPPLLLVLAAFFTQSESGTSHGRFATGFVAACSIVPLAFFSLNSSADKLSYRIETLGERVYKSYYAGASYILAVAHRMEPNPVTALQRRVAVAQRLQPFVLKEDDQYSHLLRLIGATYMERGDIRSALPWIEQAVRYSPSNNQLLIQQTEMYLASAQYDKALQSARIVIQRDSLQLAGYVQAGVAAARLGDVKSARRYLSRAKEIAPNDKRILDIFEQLGL